MKAAYQQRDLPKANTLGLSLMREHKSTGAKSPGIANDLYNLALIYDEQDQLESAISLYVESCWFVKDNDFQALAMRTSNLAGALARMGAFETAYQFFMQARHIYKRHLGASHPAYADCLYNMANIAADANQTELALNLHKEALKIREKSGSQEDTMHSLHSLAFIYEKTGDYKKAASKAEAALKNTQDQDYVSACKYLADLYEASQQHEKALEMYKQVLEKVTQTGCRRSEYLSILKHNAYLTGIVGDPAEALKLHEDAINMYHSLTSLDLLSVDPKFYADSLRNMAILNQSLGDASSAEEYMLKAIKTSKPGDDEQIKDICFLIQLYLQGDTYDKAMDMLVYALNNDTDSPTPHTGTLIDELMETLNHAPDKQKLLQAIKDINSADKVQSILGKWQGQDETEQ